MAINTTAGASISIVKAEPATYDIADFGALTFVEVGDIETMGEFGGRSQVIEFTGIKDIVTQKFKGSFNAGSMSVGLGKNVTDAGQALLVAGAIPSENGVHSVEFKDAAGDIVYFTCIVTGYTTNPADVNAVIKSTVTLELNNQAIPGQ